MQYNKQTMETYIKEMIDNKTEQINQIVDLVCNTVKAKYLYKKGGWGLVKEELGNAYCNPNFSMNFMTLGDKAKELKLNANHTTIRENLDLIAKLVNTKLKAEVVATKLDRKNHFIYIKV